ncbi:MAG: histidinol phosphate phosphatase domain-containing protein [Planctomycetota bacterium]|jgi:histidinol phosphatase-like PHP family hydrolase
MPGVVDLHCHTFHSDGVLGPAEFLRRAEVAGVEGVALTDHADSSNIERVVEALRAACESERKYGVMICAAGVELTHVRLKEIPVLVERARELGAEFVVVHGETPAEPVQPGTNRAAIEAGCDFLAHPGKITLEDAKLAAERGVILEISGRHGHNATNGHVASVAREAGVRVAYGGDCHEPENIRPPAGQREVLLGAGLSGEEVDSALAVAREILLKAGGACP